MEQITAFDWQRMFLGTQTSWLFLFEIVVRTVIMFIWTLINVRVLGKRNMGKLTPFEFLITFALGSATGDPMFYPEVPLTHGMIVISTIVGLEKLVSLLSSKSETAKEFVQGEAVLLIKYGQLLDREYIKQNLNKDELMARLRLEGIENIGEVKYAFLETSGRMSVIKYPRPARKQGESTVKLPSNQK